MVYKIFLDSSPRYSPLHFEQEGVEIVNDTSSKDGGRWWNFKPTVHAVDSPLKDAKSSICKVAPLSEPEHSLDEEAVEVLPQTPLNEEEKPSEKTEILKLAEPSNMDALKKMGEAGALIEEIPELQHLPFRIDFQVKKIKIFTINREEQKIIKDYYQV